MRCLRLPISSACWRMMLIADNKLSSVATYSESVCGGGVRNISPTPFSSQSGDKSGYKVSISANLSLLKALNFAEPLKLDDAAPIDL